MRPDENQDDGDRYDEESLSSVEDPITETQPSRSSPPRMRTIKRDMPVHTPTTTAAIAVQPDYGFYIRIIICLLAGLLLLNTLLLFRVNRIESQPALGEDVAQALKKLAEHGKSDQQTAALENLLETVNQLASDLQKLKMQISAKQEL
ncbi:hypothetical protein OSTOST_05591 [Ostertagia ostertagi]